MRYPSLVSRRTPSGKHGSGARRRYFIVFFNEDCNTDDSQWYAAEPFANTLMKLLDPLTSNGMFTPTQLGTMRGV
jgi:hypothetical protein